MVEKIILGLIKKGKFMYKKMNSLLLVGLFCLGVYGNAFADASFSWGGYGDFYLTNEADGVGDKKYSFSLDETPWAHITISKDFFFTGKPEGLTVNQDWKLFDTRTLKYQEYIYNVPWGDGDSFTKSWSLDEWATLKESGSWKLTWSGSSLPGSENVVAYADFTVTPEPISCLLFLLGGGSLAFSRFRKHKLAVRV